MHPVIAPPTEKGLPELNRWWHHTWTNLWGPPGTGKTYTTGRQVAAILRDDPDERILIVSTTNKATDAVAKSIGTAAKQLTPNLLNDHQLLRIGKGASFREFNDAGLIATTRISETDK